MIEKESYRKVLGDHECLILELDWISEKALVASNIGGHIKLEVIDIPKELWEPEV